MSRDIRHATLVWIVVCTILIFIVMIGFGELR
jgi:hypothetical protein